MLSDYVKAIGLDYWYLRANSDVSYSDKSNVNLLCLCPKSWEFNQKNQQLLKNFLNALFSQLSFRLIFISEEKDVLDHQIKEDNPIVLNFTQKTCQKITRVIKIDGTIFESMLEQPELKKQVMLDVFRNSVYVTRA